MSDDKRKHVRTQGRFAENKEFLSNSKEREKKKGAKSYTKDRIERNGHQRIDAPPKPLSSETNIQYQENSPYTFNQLQQPKKADEIRGAGEYQISDTENGPSRLFYKPDFIPSIEGYELLSTLYKMIPWQEKYMNIKGKQVLQPRLIAWYGQLPYSYSGVTLEPQEFPPEVLRIKEKVEKYLEKKEINVQLNSVLLNLYRNEKDSVAWHSDDELSMGICPTIASVSLGEVRKFEMRRKKLVVNGEKNMAEAELVVNMKHGSLIIMDGCMQKDWEHRVPKEFHGKSPRINLTFRTVYSLDKIPPQVPTQSKHFTSYAIPEVKKEFHYDDGDFPSLSNAELENHELDRQSMDNVQPALCEENGTEPPMLIPPPPVSLQDASVYKHIRDAPFPLIEGQSDMNDLSQCASSFEDKQVAFYSPKNIPEAPLFTCVSLAPPPQSNIAPTSVEMMLPSVTQGGPDDSRTLMPFPMFSYGNAMNFCHAVTTENVVMPPLHGYQEPVYAGQVIKDDYVYTNSELNHTNYIPNGANYISYPEQSTEKMSCITIADFILPDASDCDEQEIGHCLFTLVERLREEWDILSLGVRDRKELEVYAAISKDLCSSKSRKQVLVRMCEVIRNASQMKPRPCKPNCNPHEHRQNPRPYSHRDSGHNRFNRPPRMNRIN